MCQCTPEIRTPFCGKPGCEWPTVKTDPQTMSIPELIETGLRSSTYAGLRVCFDELAMRVAKSPRGEWPSLVHKHPKTYFEEIISDVENTFECLTKNPRRYKMTLNRLRRRLEEIAKEA